MIWHPQAGFRRITLNQGELDALRKHAQRLQRMKAAHDKGRHWKRCNFCV